MFSQILSYIIPNGASFYYQILSCHCHNTQHIFGHLWSINLIALTTATCGNAAGISSGGRTTHSCFKIPLNADGSSECSITASLEELKSSEGEGNTTKNRRKRRVADYRNQRKKKKNTNKNTISRLHSPSKRR